MKKSLSVMICALFLLAVGICSCSSDDENATTRSDGNVLTEWQLEIADYFISHNCGFQLWRLLYKGQYYYWFYNGVFSYFYIYDSQGNPVEITYFEGGWKDWETIYVYDPNKK